MRDHLVFYVNGRRHTLAAPHALATLSDYLRGGLNPDVSERLIGTKIACSEGDCGACTVLVGESNGDRFVYQTVDACIAFMFQLDRRHVITVEGIADESHFTPVQQAMIDGHGSQCGFCTPGFVMAMHGLTERNLTAGCRESLSDDQLRLGLSGNLCRCTGYHQILAAGASIDVAKMTVVDKRFNTGAMLAEFDSLGSVRLTGQSHDGTPVAVAIPITLEELLEVRHEWPAARLVAGATDVGVQYNHGKYAPTQVISTRQVGELRSVELTNDELIVGAAANWDIITNVVETQLPEYHKILTRFGSPQIRNMGTLAGNLANGSPIADAIPLHYVTESVIVVANRSGERSIPTGKFYLGYKQIDLAADEVIVSIRTPLPPPHVSLKLYKITKRRDMDISSVTAAFWIERDRGTIVDARVALGGVGPMVVRATAAEAIMVGQPFSLGTMQAAGRIARDEIAPISDVRGSTDYRSQLVENLFAKCFHEMTDETALLEVT